MGMLDEVVQFAEPDRPDWILRADLMTGLFGLSQIFFRQIQVDTMGLLNLLHFLLLLAFVLGSGVFEPLYFAVLLFEQPLEVFVLPPS